MQGLAARWALIILGLGALTACADPMPVEGKPEHHTTQGFRNIDVQGEGFNKSFYEFWWMRLFGDVEWPDADDGIGLTPRITTDLGALQTPDQEPQITWVGHSTFLIQYKGANILTDPIFSNRASPFSSIGPERYTPAPFKIEELPELDAVIISHNHYDHMDVNTLADLGDNPKYVVPLNNSEPLAEVGLKNIGELDWYQSTQAGDLKITLLPAQHWSARGLFDRRASLWGSYAIEFADGTKIWFGGDTGYNPVTFKRIGKEYGPFELALIPVGGYEPRSFMKFMHTNPDDAVLMHMDIGARQSIGIHWGTFVLTSEPFDEPPQALAAALKKYNIPAAEFEVMKIGETRTFPARSQP